jgi:DNA-binding winged helix-turn-helix (wHTH) protein/tetratricopeptide (TPR) repeat protein
MDTNRAEFGLKNFSGFSQPPSIQVRFTCVHFDADLSMPLPTLNPLPTQFSLGKWEVNVQLDEVKCNGRGHKLEPRTMRLLTVLAQADGAVVSGDALLNAVWPGLVVTPSSLYDAIAQLRKVLGPEPILTVARKGYRLATPVRTAVAQKLPDPAMPAPVSKMDSPEQRLGPRSVAVLPFAGHGLGQTLPFLSESLTGALIAELSRQPGLTVVAFGTMLTLGQRHTPPQQVSRDLGARFVVDGQLALHGNTLHVSVAVADGWHGTQTWADTIELSADAWHEAAAVVVGRLARALRFEINDLASQAAVAASDADLQARALAAQAWVQLFARPQTPQTNQCAAELAGQARALAPQLAQAWMCLAYCDWRAAHYWWSTEPRDSQLARSLAEAEQAVALAPRDPDAFYVLSLPCRILGQLHRAEEALHHCLRLAASYAPAHGLLALWCVRNGQISAARDHVDQAFALSPLEPLRVIWHAARAEAFLVEGNPQAAVQEAQRGMTVNPAHSQVYLFATAAAWQLGDVARANAWVLKLREHKAFGSLAAVRVALAPTYAPAQAQQFEQLMDLLRQAGLPAGG